MGKIKIFTRHLDFLKWVQETYGSVFVKSTAKIGSEYGCSGQTVRSYLFRLELTGFVEIDRGREPFLVRINEERAKEALAI